MLLYALELVPLELATLFLWKLLEKGVLIVANSASSFSLFIFMSILGWHLCYWSFKLLVLSHVLYSFWQLRHLASFLSLDLLKYFHTLENLCFRILLFGLYDEEESDSEL